MSHQETWRVNSHLRGLDSSPLSPIQDPGNISRQCQVATVLRAACSGRPRSFPPAECCAPPVLLHDTIVYTTPSETPSYALSWLSVDDATGTRTILDPVKHTKSRFSSFKHNRTFLGGDLMSMLKFYGFPSQGLADGRWKPG